MLAHVDDMQTVSEAAIIEAVRLLFYRLKIVVEPSGALGVAALLSGAVTGYHRIGVVLSGGNIDGIDDGRDPVRRGAGDEVRARLASDRRPDRRVPPPSEPATPTALASRTMPDLLSRAR